MKRDDYARHSKRVTATKRWKTLRAAILERDGYACVACGTRRGRLEIDHIKPVRTHPDLAFHPANCATLCQACHTRKTRLEVGQPALPEDRQEWRDCVLALSRGDDRGIIQKDIDDA